LGEQLRIAAILDKADALCQKRSAVLRKLDCLTQSIFLDMFGEADERAEGIKEMKDIVRPGTIITYGIVQAGKEFPGGTPYIRTGDIVDGEVLEKHLRHTDPSIALRFARSMVREGDIVMSIRATVGTVAMVSRTLDGANLTQGTARISPGELVDGTYLLHYLRSARVQRWIQRQVKGATFREITLGRLRELPVVVPPLDLQLIFARRVKRLQAIARSAGRSQSRLQGLLDALKASAFRGEL
jgi:type I restriction enzyme, S subunit